MLIVTAERAVRDKHGRNPSVLADIPADMCRQIRKNQERSYVRRSIW